MILSKKKPAPLRQPVQVTTDEVHLYYARPVLLGRVTRGAGHYWVTEDGVRHESTRRALDYLAARYEKGEITEWVPPAPAPRAARTKRAPRKPVGEVAAAAAPGLAGVTTGGSLLDSAPVTTTPAPGTGDRRSSGGATYAGPERRGAGSAARQVLRDIDRETVDALLTRLVELEQAALLRRSTPVGAEQESHRQRLSEGRGTSLDPLEQTKSGKVAPR